nr:hypothetical protein [Tanacetum cinerariifolium]
MALMFIVFLPDMPKEYTYEPWTAPLSVQAKANCIIGIDYLKPIISHDVASKNVKGRSVQRRVKQEKNGAVSDEDMQNLRRKLVVDQTEGTDSKRLKQKLI